MVAIIGIIAAFAVPGLMRARMSGNEASAIGSLRAINSAQSTYAAGCGSGFYAPSLANLATAPLVAGGDGFIGPDLATDPSLKSSLYVCPGARRGSVRGSGLVQRRGGWSAGLHLFRRGQPDRRWRWAILRDEPGRDDLPRYGGGSGNPDRSTSWHRADSIDSSNRHVRLTTDTGTVT